MAQIVNYLVVYICNILDILDIEFKVVTHDSPYDISRDVISCMAQMSIAIVCQGVKKHEMEFTYSYTVGPHAYHLTLF